MCDAFVEWSRNIVCAHAEQQPLDVLKFASDRGDVEMARCSLRNVTRDKLATAFGIPHNGKDQSPIKKMLEYLSKLSDPFHINLLHLVYTADWSNWIVRSWEQAFNDWTGIADEFDRFNYLKPPPSSDSNNINGTQESEEASCEDDYYSAIRNLYNL